MIGIVTVLRWVSRIDGIVALFLGLLLWSGAPGSLKIHILTGFVMTITLLLIGLLGFFNRIKLVLPIISIVWAILLPYLGFAQLKMLPGASHVVIQTIHLLVGICAIGLVEATGGKIIRAGRP